MQSILHYILGCHLYCRCRAFRNPSSV